MLIDSHAHLSSQEVRPFIEDLLQRALSNHIQAIVNIATTPEELNFGLKLQAQYPWIYNAGSTTPHEAATLGNLHFDLFAQAAKEGKLVAIGETGLDYYYYSETKSSQQELLIRYLELALSLQLPVVIHCRDAFQDLFQILDQHYQVNGRYGKGVLHCFTGTIEEAEEVIKRGFFLSLSGIATYKKSASIREVAVKIPLENLLIETDTPYLAPQSKRGQTNEPAYLIETARILAAEKQLSLDDFSKATSLNAKRLFQI